MKSVLIVISVLVMTYTASAVEFFGPSPKCKKELENLSVLQRTALRWTMLMASEMMELRDQGVNLEELVGKRIRVIGIDLDTGHSGEFRILVNDLRRAVLIGCEGIEGIVISIDRDQVTIKQVDDKLVQLSYSKDFKGNRYHIYDKIFFQYME